jgi:hypothetical protein
MQTRIDVRAVPIPRGVADLADAHHLFVVWVGPDGREMFLRGGPGNDKLGPLDEDSMGFKAITCTWGPYLPGTVDWNPAARSVTAAVGYAPESYEKMVNACRTITFMGIGYRLLGPNSNTVARTLLAVLGIPPKKPDVLTPGWDLPPLVR